MKLLKELDLGNMVTMVVDSPWWVETWQHPTMNESIKK
jgi:hypothetical protein